MTQFPLLINCLLLFHLFSTEFADCLWDRYIGIPIYLLFLLGYKVICKTKTVNPYEADLFSGKAEVDRQEEEFLAEQAARSKTEQPQRKFYRIFISWLF